jgi:DNA ligase-associated metallophosphoesterase
LNVLGLELTIAGEQLVLHPHRVLHWPRMRWLVASDLHLGKAAHLRKGGLPLPESHDERTLRRLNEAIATFRPERIVLLGDLFHSSMNTAWERLSEWTATLPCPLHLVPGNHDVLALRRYHEAGIRMCADRLEEGPFTFTHDTADATEGYAIGGHLHPGVGLHGRGRQWLRVPCFWFGEHRGLLPAMGAGTGLHLIDPQPGDRVLACTDRAVLEVSASPAGRAEQHR